jgi:Phytanoyl-CoA dioxygenase (PhyH)
LLYQRIGIIDLSVTPQCAILDLSCFETDGFSVLGLGQTDLCGTLIGALENIKEQRDVHRIHSEDIDGYSMAIVTNPHLGSQAFADLISGILNRLDPIFSSSGLVEGSYVLSKTAGHGMSVPWHQDSALATYRTSTPSHRISAWMPLQDTSVDNGGLWIYPRSHKAGKIYHVTIEHRNGLNQRRIRDEDLCKLDSPSPLTVKAGDVVLLHENVIHGSFRSFASTCRHALVIDYAFPLEKPDKALHLGQL